MIAPRISVVIPTYNSAALVVEAVQSVLAQTVPAAEVIVVDDGSGDDTGERVATFGARVRYVRKENGGVSTARTRGIAEATGEWIAFLDADDVWHPRKLEIQLAVLAGRPELGVLGARVYHWPGPRPDAKPTARWPVTDVGLDDLIVGNVLATSTLLVRADLLRAAGPFDPALRGPEDHDMWIRLARLAPVANVEAALTGYRLATPGSLSKNAVRMEAGMRSILGKLEAAGAFRGKPRLRRKAWANFRYRCGFMYRDEGRPGTATDRFVRALAASLVAFNHAPGEGPGARLRTLLSTIKTLVMLPGSSRVG